MAISQAGGHDASRFVGLRHDIECNNPSFDQNASLSKSAIYAGVFSLVILYQHTLAFTDTMWIKNDIDLWNLCYERGIWIPKGSKVNSVFSDSDDERNSAHGTKGPSEQRQLRVYCCGH
jgi:hypothetical protein